MEYKDLTRKYISGILFGDDLLDHLPMKCLECFHDKFNFIEFSNEDDYYIYDCVACKALNLVVLRNVPYIYQMISLPGIAYTYDFVLNRSMVLFTRESLTRQELQGYYPFNKFKKIVNFK